MIALSFLAPMKSSADGGDYANMDYDGTNAISICGAQYGIYVLLNNGKIF